MRLFITNLLIATMLVMPMHAWASHMRCGCDDQRISQPEADAAECCCPPAADQGERSDEPEPRPMPCDQQDCPSGCCSMTLVSAFVIPMPTSLVTISVEQRTLSPIEQTDCSSPHLLRLKRPPRSA